MLVCDPQLLENDFLRIELNEAGDITRIFDKIAGREVLPEGAIANQMQALRISRLVGMPGILIYFTMTNCGWPNRQRLCV